MDHDVAEFSEPSLRTDDPTSLEDETTVIVPRTGPHSSPRPLPRKHTPEGAPLRMQGSSVVQMVPRKRAAMPPTPAPLPPRKTPPPRHAGGPVPAHAPGEQQRNTALISRSSPARAARAAFASATC